MPETFPLTPEFVWTERYDFQTIQTPFESGHIQTRAKWTKARRHWVLLWHHATVDEAEQLRAFARDMQGAATSFSYSTVDPIPRPYAAPTMGQTSGGSLGARTRYAGFTWVDDSNNETTASVNTGSLAISANYLLTVTVPDFPSNVTHAHVYVGATAGVLYEQATGITTSGGTWTEPTGGYATGTDNPPSTNSLTETATVHFLDDRIEVVKIHANYYSMRVELEEIF